MEPNWNKLFWRNVTITLNNYLKKYKIIKKNNIYKNNDKEKKQTE